MDKAEVDEVMRAGARDAVMILNTLKGIVCHENFEAWLTLFHARLYLEGRYHKAQRPLPPPFT